jgi:hypothetical protein
LVKLARFGKALDVTFGSVISTPNHVPSVAANLIDGGRGAPRAGVDGLEFERQSSGTPDGHLREAAVYVATFHRAAEHQVMIAPSLVASRAAGLQGAAKFGFGERRDLIRDAEVLRGAVERQHAVGHLPQQIELLPALPGVRVETAQRAKEDLALQTEGGLELPR